MSKFAMTEQQRQAFETGTNGVSASTFNHTVLFLIGAITVIWLFLIFIGTLKNKERSLYESVAEFAMAVGIATVMGVIVYYSN